MSAPDRKSIYVVDDDTGVRESLSLLLELHGFKVESFDSAEAFLAVVDRAGPGCVIADLRLPGMDGLALHRALRERGVSLPVVIITGHGDVAAARSSFKAGAIDFIEKPLDEEQLLAAIAQALATADAQREHSERSQQLGERLARLTERERQVLDQVVAGKHNREIAAILGISARTVEVYKARLMEKLQVRRVPELVRLVVGVWQGPTPRNDAVSESAGH
jgi:RNA polymerase sigma factor (sigma-70 family)